MLVLQHLSTVLIVCTIYTALNKPSNEDEESGRNLWQEWYENGNQLGLYPILDNECDCGGNLRVGNYHRYFNPSFNYVDAKGNAKDLTADEVIRYTKQDFKHMESLNDGSECFYGVMAEAEITVGDICQTITSGGIWGIESYSDDSYFKEMEDEQLHKLKQQLTALGFSKRAISTAFKNVEHTAE